MLGRASEEDASLRRYRSILRGGASALIAKAVSALAVLVAVPLTLNYLGPERYGLWVTLYSVIAWLSLVDIGLTNGLMNALTGAYGKQRRDLAREYVSVAFWGLTILAFSAGIFISTTSLWIDWTSTFHIKTAGLSAEFAWAATIGAVLFMMGLPMTVVGQVYIAYQHGELSNAWAAVAALGGLLGLALAVYLEGNLSALVIGFTGGQLLVRTASAIWLFTKVTPDLRPSLHFSRASFQKMFHIGGAFFVAQLATLMMFQSGSIIITSYLGPEHVPPYQVTWMLFFYATLPQQLVGASIWATVGEAYARNDINWIRALLKRYLHLSITIGIPLILLLGLFYEPIIKYWAGSAAVPTTELAYWMAAWSILLILMQPLMAVLGGTGRMHAYSFFNIIVATIAVAGAVMAVMKYGPVGVIASITIGMAFLAIISAYLVRQILNVNQKPI